MEKTKQKRANQVSRDSRGTCNELPYFPDWLANACGFISAFLLAFVIIWAMSGCSTQNYCQKRGYYQQTGNDTTTATTVIVRDSLVPFFLAADSGYLAAYLECVNDKIKLVEISNFSGGNHVKPEISVRDNYVYVACKVDSFSIYTTWRTKECYKELNTRQAIVKITNELTGWQTFWVGAGKLLSAVLLLIIVIYTGIYIIRKYVA